MGAHLCTLQYYSQVNKLHFNSYFELSQNLKQNGVEPFQPVIFIDFSGSNTSSGLMSYGMEMHSVKMEKMPYEMALQTLMPVLTGLSELQELPVYRFGCADTRDRSVMPLCYPGISSPSFARKEDITVAYRKAISFVELAGPTTFAPAIAKGIEIARNNEENDIYRQIVVIILTDGDVSDPERDKQAICDASEFPISICVLGIGDGPFLNMHQFDTLENGRRFDNFHFTNFTAFLKGAQKCENPELELAADVFTGAQYAAMKGLGILGLWKMCQVTLQE